MPRFVRALKTLTVCAAWLLMLWINSADAAVTIETTDGRVLTGEVDVDTDDTHLWIRQEAEQIQLSTSVSWEQIAAAHEGERELPLEQLPELLRSRTTKAEPLPLILPVSYEQPTDCVNCGANLAVAEFETNRTTRVRSLDIAAYLVNMDRDVEPDGLELWIAALDENGLSVPVSGSLSVRLWGERIHPHGSLIQHEDLQQWSKTVKQGDFDADGLASYRLRFRTVNPEFDLGLHSEALIHVRLSVRGQGNYEASVPVQIRTFNPVRDRLQLTRGGRFFPDELTEETRHQLPHRTHTRSLRSR